MNEWVRLSAYMKVSIGSALEDLLKPVNTGYNQKQSIISRRYQLATKQQDNARFRIADWTKANASNL